MDAGQLNRRITIQNYTLSGNDFSTNAGKNWANFATGVPAKFENIGGSEGETANQRQTDSFCKFIIRYRADIDTKMRVVFNSVNYDIERIEENKFGFKMFTDIYVRATK